jgi:hypothetical protein
MSLTLPKIKELPANDGKNLMTKDKNYTEIIAHFYRKIEVVLITVKLVAESSLRMENKRLL